MQILDKMFFKKNYTIQLKNKNIENNFVLNEKKLSHCCFCNSIKLINCKIENTQNRLQKQWTAEGFKSVWSFCENCGLVLQTNRPCDATFKNFYENSFYRTANSVLTIQDAWINYSKIQFDRFKPFLNITKTKFDKKSGTVLDFGCGLGLSLHSFRKNKWQCFGVEVDAALSDFAAKHGGLTMISNLDAIEKEKFDIIFSHHSLEHMSNPYNFIQFVGRCLKPDGFCLIATPTWRYGYSKNILNAFSLTDSIVADHSSLNFAFRGVGLGVTSFMYQHISDGGDWEFAALIKKTKDSLETEPATFTEFQKTMARVLNNRESLKKMTFVLNGN